MLNFWNWTIFDGVFFIVQNVVGGPKDSASVERAKERHFTLYDKIAADHVRIGAELEAQRALFESTSEKDLCQPTV